MYNEIYFSSAKECNDPFDGKVFLQFGSDKEKWKRLLEFAWRHYNIENKAKWEEYLAEYLAKISPLSFDTALKLNYTEMLLSLESHPDLFLALLLGDSIKQVLALYQPRDTYFVSFSRTSTDILMWSHYASMHKGHCLIFKAIEGHLFQCPERRKSVIKRTTSSMSWSIPDKFLFRDVSYISDSEPGDAFSCFPEYVLGKKLDVEEQVKLARQQNECYLTKHSCWEYEKEVRLTLSPPYGWLFGEKVDLSPQERLFHYQPSQLVGIILGARMEESQKMRIREIIREHMERIACRAQDYTAIFDFVLFQAKLSDTRREVVVIPEEIYGLGVTWDNNHNEFSARLNRWKEGWATVIRGNKGWQDKFD